MRYLLFSFLFFGCSLLIAQQPFVCAGDFYLSLSDFNGSSQVYSVSINPTSGDVDFNALPNTAGTTLNAIGYRSTDNFIYALDPLWNRLYRIDATGVATLLTTPNLDPSYGYYGAEITPDGNHYILLGNNNTGSRIIVAIDLTSPTYPIAYTRNLTFSNGSINSSDIAFDPLTGQLYAFDSGDNRLVTIDLDTGMVDNSTFPSNTVAEKMGALFFNAFGDLFGYGESFSSNTARELYRIDIETGEVSLQATGPPAIGKDGCSCPYTVNLNKTVSQSFAYPCTEVFYTFEIANQSANPQVGLDFLDELPTGLTIMEIVENPFGGMVESGVETSILSIKDITVPGGINELIIRVRIDENTMGILENQAMLMGLPAALGEVALSDNPATLAQSDPTILEVVPLFVDLQNQQAQICKGESFTINAAQYGGVDYIWNDGSTGSTLTIDSAGLYTVTVTNGCEIVIDSVHITENTLFLELGEDQEILLGDSIVFAPQIFTSGRSLSYTWTAILENSLTCNNCMSPSSRPFFDNTYQLFVSDENGCEASDEIRITVNKFRGVYAPTAFSPNNDDNNDRFFLQGRSYVKINYLNIYDRWGNLVFNKENHFINESKQGWDGTFQGKVLNPAVFVWTAELEYLDGVVEFKSGEVNLFR